jgi:toxin FitB
LTFLIDTNVISEIRKPQPNTGVADWFATTESKQLFLSVLVIGEITQGIERLRRRRDPLQADQFERWLAVLRNDFADRLLPVTVRVAERWGRLNAAQPLPVIDGLLAATAIDYGLTLVTRDTRGVGSTGVDLLDPWRNSPS